MFRSVLVMNFIIVKTLLWFSITMSAWPKSLKRNMLHFLSIQGRRESLFLRCVLTNFYSSPPIYQACWTSRAFLDATE